MAYTVLYTPGSDTNCAECGKPLPQRDTKDPVITKVNTGGMVSEYLHYDPRMRKQHSTSVMLGSS